MIAERIETLEERTDRITRCGSDMRIIMMTTPDPKEREAKVFQYLEARKEDPIYESIRNIGTRLLAWKTLSERSYKAGAD